ncbi:MAG: hypothetical protein KAJ10_06290 [Thermodesulfovibrionia bacterium]|nr:hypothetical protein [Thermodesulfovibrionia bacterium]
MKKIFIILLLPSIIFSPCLLLAETAEERRRIEEEKRDELRSSEGHPLKQQEEKTLPLSFVDRIYFAELMTRKISYRYDASKIFVLLMGVENQYIDMDSQIIFLKEKNFLPKKFEADFSPREPLRKGLFAYMLYKALDVKGGITLSLFGVSERYALKELVYQGILASGNENDILTGEELVSTTMRAAEFISKKNLSKIEETTK